MSSKLFHAGLAGCVSTTPPPVSDLDAVSIKAVVVGASREQIGGAGPQVGGVVLK